MRSQLNVDLDSNISGKRKGGLGSRSRESALRNQDSESRLWKERSSCIQWQTQCRLQKAGLRIIYKESGERKGDHGEFKEQLI